VSVFFMEAEPPKDAVPLDQSMIAAITAVLG